MADNAPHIGAWQSGTDEDDQPHIGAWQGELEGESLLPINLSFILNNHAAQEDQI